MQLQLDVLEPDYLDESKWGWIDGGGEIHNGIEFDAEGRRVAYWLFPEHPGGDVSPRVGRGISERVPVDEVLHIYRQDRPGQRRGVTWFAPVVMRLQDLADHEDAQLMRQKIAACFAVFRSGGDGTKASELSEIEPGLIYDLGDTETVNFATPPGVEAYDEFTRSVLRSVAAASGIDFTEIIGTTAPNNRGHLRAGLLWNSFTRAELLAIPANTVIGAIAFCSDATGGAGWVWAKGSSTTDWVKIDGGAAI